MRRYGPQLYNELFTRQFPEFFPVDAAGKPTTDHIATLVAMAEDRTLVPEALTLRTMPDGAATGESRYMMNRYLAERGDPEIRSNADLVAKSSFHDDPQFPDRRAARERQEQAKRARYVGAHGAPLRGATARAAVHVADGARRARLSHEQLAAAEARRARRADA